MARKSKKSRSRLFRKTLIDAWRGMYEEEWEIDAEDLGLAAVSHGYWSVWKYNLVGGQQHGVEVVTVDNGRFSFDIVPTRGMGIQEAEYEGVRLGWDSPVGEIVHPRHIRLEDRGGLGWLRGASEWFMRCGLANNGQPGLDVTIDNQGNRSETLRTLHGRIQNTPASMVTVSVDLEPPHTIAVHGTVFETSFFGENLRLDTTLSTEPGANWLRVEDTVTNLRAVPAEMQMLYHINYGPPLLEEGSRLLAPVDAVVPVNDHAAEQVRRYDRYGPPAPGLPERCYFFIPRKDRKGLSVHGMTNAAGDLAVSHEYPLKALPCFTQWKNEAALEDGYVTGLEPATNYPNNIAFERQRKRVVKLGPGKSWSADVRLAVHQGKKEVDALKRRVRAIQGRRKPDVASAPQAGFCVGA